MSDALDAPAFRLGSCRRPDQQAIRHNRPAYSTVNSPAMPFKAWGVLSGSSSSGMKQT
jgi:hypothetical protein